MNLGYYFYHRQKNDIKGGKSDEETKGILYKAIRCFIISFVTIFSSFVHNPLVV
jgi:hypothetical protein